LFKIFKPSQRVYRFSISWSRILPDGKMPNVNRKGVEFYNNLIDELIKNGIVPFATLYHWDLPQSLQTEYNGLLSDKFVLHFAEYAKICFQLFGDRVKNWITFNEPFVISVHGSDFGVMAPGRCNLKISLKKGSDRSICKEGDSAVEIYQVTHNLLNAHALAVNIYRTEFSSQRGIIGITLNSDWNEPRSDSKEDTEAAQRLQEFQLAWFADPVFFGDYPESMKKSVDSRLPEFTEKQKQLLKGSSDFLGINGYTSRYVANGVVSRPGFQQDSKTIAYTTDLQGNLIGPLAWPEWLYVVPW
jgi:beta-glucosidase/6-phospho-beta-glucosidase/beta-galactosidase